MPLSKRALDMHTSEVLVPNTDATAAISGPAIPPVTECAIHYSQCNKSAFPRIDHNCLHPGSLLPECDLSSSGPSFGSDNISSFAVHNTDSQSDSATFDVNGFLVNNLHFQTVPRPKRRIRDRVAFGNNSDDEFKGTTDEEVKSFLERKQVYVVDIKRVSLEE